MMQPATYLPLVSREHLSEEDHALILQKMVNGGIASKEEILDALDKDEYNNITATYFLLAERKLRAQRQEQALMVSRGQAPTVASPPLHSASLPPIPRELDDTKVWWQLRKLIRHGPVSLDVYPLSRRPYRPR